MKSHELVHEMEQTFEEEFAFKIDPKGERDKNDDISDEEKEQAI